MKKGDSVLITTEYRGVFFGKLKSWDEDKKVAVIDSARNVVYWSADCHGFLGLAANGPTKGCRIGPKVDGLELHKVTARVPVTKEAAEKFEVGQWS